MVPRYVRSTKVMTIWASTVRTTASFGSNPDACIAFAYAHVCVGRPRSDSADIQPARSSSPTISTEDCIRPMIWGRSYFYLKKGTQVILAFSVPEQRETADL